MIAFRETRIHARKPGVRTPLNRRIKALSADLEAGENPGGQAVAALGTMEWLPAIGGAPCNGYRENRFLQ
jgi:hypothetical protein